ncbi:hypothetical protein GCM10020331_102430 [Ectobacillus funiculus]
MTYYAEWVLGVQRQANAPFIVTEWIESERLMIAKNMYQEIFRDATAFFWGFIRNKIQIQVPRLLRSKQVVLFLLPIILTI